MRVMVVLLSVNLFGTERHAVELSNALAEAGHDVALVLRERPSDPARQAGYAALRALIAPGVRLFTVGRRLPGIGLAAAVLRFRPQVIHAHSERSARWAARLPLGAPVIASNHCGYAPDYDRCDGLICLTRAQTALIGPHFRGQVFRIGNWVLPQPRPSAAQVAALRRDLGLAPDDYVVGSVARLAPEKGFAGLIDAFMAADLPGARLVIVGDGALEGELRARAAPAGSRIVFAGFRKDVRLLYHAFDLFVLNSSVEQFVLVVLEALEAGLPVIATASEGATEIASRSPIRLIPIGDTAALTGELVRADAERPRGTPDAAAPFRMAAVLPQIVAAYQAVASAARRAS